MVQYKLLDIYSIKDTLNDYQLDANISSKITELFTLLNINNQRNKNTRKEKYMQEDNAKWVKKELFKPTVMEKKEGMEEELDNLRSLLNKLVDNNYDDQIIKIMDCIDNIIKIDDPEKYEKILQRFYSVVINNKRYSKSYSKVFSNMLDEYLLLEEHQHECINKYNESINNIEYMNPDENYDEYCRINKLNSQRKSLLCFIISCVDCEVYSFNELLQIINHLFIMLDNNITNEDQQDINEEIVENIFTLLQNGKDLILNEVCKYEILDKIKYYSTLNTKENSGYSNRMKFKMMDIIDLYK